MADQPVNDNPVVSPQSSPKNFVRGDRCYGCSYKFDDADDIAEVVGWRKYCHLCVCFPCGNPYCTGCYGCIPDY